jgi:hypothetical protein
MAVKPVGSKRPAILSRRAWQRLIERTRWSQLKPWLAAYTPAPLGFVIALANAVATESGGLVTGEMGR